MAGLRMHNPALAIDGYAVDQQAFEDTWEPKGWVLVDEPGSLAFATTATIISDTAANFAAANPILDTKVFGFEEDTGILKCGDGVTAWNDLGRIPQSTESQRASSASATASPITSAAIDHPDLPSITFTVDDVPWYVEYEAPYLLSTTAAVVGNLIIADASNVAKAQKPIDFRATGAYLSARVTEYIEDAGTYTRKGRIQKASGSGGITVGSGSALHTAFIRAYPEP